MKVLLKNKKEFPIDCVIFAGGKSSRMGEDKALLSFGQKSLAKYQYDRLSQIFEKVYICTKEPKFDFEAPLILDSYEIFAPTPAFLDIFEQIPEFFAISVDAPFVDSSVTQPLLETAAKYPHKDAIVARTDYPHPLIGIYRRSIAPLLAKEIQKGNYKLGAILKKADTLFVDFKEDKRFLNLNTPADLEKAKNLL